MSNSILNVDQIQTQSTTDVKLVTPCVINLEKFDQVMATSLTIETGKNALSVGPVTLQDGVVITIADGCTWVIV